VGSAREEPPVLLDIGSMTVPDYPSAWLHPCRARFSFIRQGHCSSMHWPVIVANCSESPEMSVPLAVAS